MGSGTKADTGLPVSHAVVAVHQPLLRQGIHDLVGQAGLEAHPIRIFDFDSLLAVLTKVPVMALLVLCFALPGMNGVHGVQRLRGRFPTQPILVIVEEPKRDTIRNLISAGADGIVPLSSDAEAVVRAMAAVASGDMYVPRFAASDMEHDIPHAPSVAGLPAEVSLGDLTERQREVLHWVALGESNKTIGRRLNISPHTVNMHVRAVFRVLGVHCRIEAVNKLAALSMESMSRVPGAFRRRADNDLSAPLDPRFVSDEPSFNFS